MNKSKILFCMCCLAGCAVLCAQEPTERKKDVKPKKVYVPKNIINSEEYAVSNTRIAKIKSVVQEKFDKHEDLENDVTRTAIEQEISRSMPLNPTSPPDARTIADIRSKQEPLVNAKFSQDILVYKKSVMDEFDKQNPLYKKGDNVTVYYRRGSSTYRITGKYYGYGVGGNTIRINSKNIPIIDLLPQDRIHFDTNFHKEKAEAYADIKLRKYNYSKNEYAQKLLKTEITKQCKTNEQRGYILQDGNWVSPKVVLDDHMKHMIEQQKRRAEKEALIKAEQEKNKPAEQNPEGAKEMKESESEEETDEE